MTNKRQAARTLHCVWCARVRSGQAWLAERRRARTVPYAHAICQRCRSFYLKGFDLEGFLEWYRQECR